MSGPKAECSSFISILYRSFCSGNQACGPVSSWKRTGPQRVRGLLGMGHTRRVTLRGEVSLALTWALYWESVASEPSPHSGPLGQGHPSLWEQKILGFGLLPIQ